MTSDNQNFIMSSKSEIILSSKTRETDSGVIKSSATIDTSIKKGGPEVILSSKPKE